MKRYTQLGLVLILIGCLAACGSEPTATKEGEKGAAAASATYVFGATLIPGDGSPVIENSAILIENGKIKAIGARADVKPVQGAGRDDVTGKFIMPVLVNLHGHPGLNNGSSFGPDNYTKQSVENDLKRYLYYGVGTVLIAGTDKDDISLQVRDEIKGGKLKAASVYTAGRGITAKGGWPTPVLKGMPLEANSTADATGAVDENAGKKVDFIKIWVDDNGGTVPKLKPEVFKAAIDEAHKKNLKVVAHVFYLADAKDLVKAGVDGIIHSIRDKEVDDELVNDMKSKNVFYAPTLTAHESKFIYADNPKWLGEQSMREAYPAALSAYLANETFYGKIKRDPNLEKYREQYKIALKNLKKLADGGVKITLGTDSGIANTFPGYWEHRELQLMGDAGMSPSDIIKAATVNSAAVLGITDGGALAVGKRADFLILTANPMDKIANSKEIESMYINGDSLERLPLLQGIETEVHGFTPEEKKNEKNAQVQAAIDTAEAKLTHYGKFPKGQSTLVGGVAIPTPLHSTASTKKGPPHIVTVTGIKGSGADAKEFYDVILPKEFGWTKAGSCFEKTNNVSKKTMVACVEGSNGGAVITINEK